MNITDVCIRRSVLAWMIMGGTILFGLVAASRIGVSQMPDVDSPNVTVSIGWPGAAPEEVERGIIEPLEQALAQVEGVQTINATARVGSARLTAVFAIGRNIDLALQDVQAKVAQAQRQLPKEVEQPTVSKSNPDDQPLLTIGVRGPFSRQVLSDVARYQVQQKLQTIPGVGQITTSGYLNRNIRVWVDAAKLIERNVTVSDITSALTKQHVVIPGGQLQTPGRDITVQVLGEALNLDALKHIVVSPKTAKMPIYLEDVALVEDGFEDVRTAARADGIPLQALQVLKQRGANAVTVAADVKAAVDQLRKTVPAGMDLDILMDTTKFIQESVHEIELELILAVILTSLVCWLFLGSLSGTVNVLLAIPMSLFGTIAIIWGSGFTLNTFTLLGLSLAIGLVVDDAVMIMENIDRHGKMGKDSFKAASEGTHEISFAALAATAAVIAIFMPVIFMEGVVGRYFLQFGVTLSVAVALSYVEAITLAPARCARLLSHDKPPGFMARIGDRFFHWLAGIYKRILGTVLNHPWKMLLGSSLVMIGCFVLGFSLPSEFTPAQDQSSFNVRITAPMGSDVTLADQYAHKVEEVLYTHPEIDSVLTTVMPGSASMTVKMVEPSERKETQQQFTTRLRRELTFPGARIAIQDPSQLGIGSSRGYPIDISIRGPDFPTLVAQALKVRDELQASGIATDVNTDYQVGLSEVRIEPDRARTTDLGVAIQDLGTTVNTLVGGTIVGKYSSGGRRLDVRMRMLLAQRLRPEDIGNINVRTQSGHLVPLSTMVNVEEKPVLQSINHVDRERAISVTANVAPGHFQSEALTVVEGLAKDFPPGYRAVLGGQSSEFKTSMNSLLFALIFGIAVAYMILAAQFNSFLHPVTVLTILPLSVAGALVGLWIGGKTLSIYSMIGILLLMGITKKNSIILVDYTNQARDDKKLGARDALLEAGPIRLRPILMTTAATMMAAVPSALGLGAGSETRGPMAIAVLGGLTLSTLLSLLVVPAFYLVADRAKSRLMRKKPAAVVTQAS
jgi:multidrug efflux pump